jgi:ubiquinone/menaquinone biosynthesis C-methylase UbiE
VGGADIFSAGKVRDGAGNFDNAVVRPHGKSKGIKSAAQEIAGFPVEGTKFLDVAAGHGGIVLD